MSKERGGRLTDSQSKSVVLFAGAGVVSFAAAVARFPWQTAVNKLWLTSRNPAATGIPAVTTTARSKVRVMRPGRWFDLEDGGEVSTDACSTLRSVPYILGSGGGWALLLGWRVVLPVSVGKFSPLVNL